MAHYDMPRNPTPGTDIRAGFGRSLISSVNEVKLVQRPGMRISRTSYGTMVEFDTQKKEEEETQELYPFKVRWMTFDDGEGEWQIYLPRGCVTVEMNGLSRAYVPVNTEGKKSDGSSAFRWFKIEDPKDSDGYAGKMNGYAALQWTVYVHMKPWPRMKISTAEEDDDFGIDQWAKAVATIGEIRVDESTTWHPVNNMMDESTIENKLELEGTFGIRYDIEGDSPGTEPKVQLVNQMLNVGRVQKSIKEPTNIKGWESVWVKLTHEEEEMEMEIKKDLDGEESDDKKTVFKLYELEDDVVTGDFRDEMPTLDFYTAPSV